MLLRARDVLLFACGFAAAMLVIHVVFSCSSTSARPEPTSRAARKGSHHRMAAATSLDHQRNGGGRNSSAQALQASIGRVIVMTVHVSVTELMRTQVDSLLVFLQHPFTYVAINNAHREMTRRQIREDVERLPAESGAVHILTPHPNKQSFKGGGISPFTSPSAHHAFAIMHAIRQVANPPTANATRQRLIPRLSSSDFIWMMDADMALLSPMRLLPIHMQSGKHWDVATVIIRRRPTRGEVVKDEKAHRLVAV